MKNFMIGFILKSAVGDVCGEDAFNVVDEGAGGQFSLKVMPLKNHIAIECSRQLCYALLRKTNVRVEECFNICNRSQFATTSSI